MVLRNRKAKPMAMQRVFIMNPAMPLRHIIEIDCMIVVGEKRTWAENVYGDRHQIGTSAFYTLASAERAKRGALVKIVETRTLANMRQTRMMYYQAQKQLTLYDTTGQFKPGKKVN